MSVSAAAPRTAAPSPNSDARTSHPDQAAESTRSSSTVADVLDEPRSERAETATEHDDVDVEQVHRRGEPDAEVAARLGEAPSTAGSPAPRAGRAPR